MDIISPSFMYMDVESIQSVVVITRCMLSNTGLTQSCIMYIYYTPLLETYLVVHCMYGCFKIEFRKSH